MQVSALSKYFALIIIAAFIIALLTPATFMPILPFIPYLLAVIMLVIGIHVKLKEFINVSHIKYQFIGAVILKSILTALLAYFIGISLSLTTPELIGLIIVGACPGGTASNLMALLSRANLAFAVTLTIVTTLLAPIVMPSVIWAFLHTSIEVPFIGIIKTLILVTLLPIILGIIINCFLKLPDMVTQKLPLIAIIAITLIVMSVVALNRPEILHLPIKLFIGVVLLHIIASFVGYLAGRALKLDHPSRLSLLFEFSILDVGLGIVIAVLFFGKEAALAGTLYAVWQNIAGPIFVSILTRKSPSQPTAQ
ncbi:bile acid:sodium symporter family protein [Fangia hongkongensis]|uniref:bile acid:sodium symporter family protein n=1 Tax=Fangia hongkongensis TaxID=270495 RepID=UPI00035CF04A|nr:bile acid:sodium symporter family protein [Fangia hongkongensis]MBK2124479.1 bile acid:sodium symporter family protein [Fangia hongkongensis]